MHPYVILHLNGRNIMKILNISVSMLAFVLLSSLSCASNALNDDLGATETRAPVGLVSRALWLPVKAGYSLLAGVALGGAIAYNGAHETYLAVSNTGTHQKMFKQEDGTSIPAFKVDEKGEYLRDNFGNKIPADPELDDRSQRLSRFESGLFGVFPGSVGGLFLGTGFYFWNSDAYGLWTESTPGGSSGSDQPSPLRKAIESGLKLLTLPGRLFG